MNYRNARYVSPTLIDCEIEHSVHGWVPYTLDPADTDGTVDNDALLLAIGDDAEAYVPPTQEELDVATAAQVRGERDNILVTVVDPLVSNPLRWADLTAAKQTEWSQYRTDLLGVPKQAGFPNNITWPTEP